MLERTVDADADPRWSCARKKAYPDMRMAQGVVNRARARDGTVLVAYACTHCGRYHVGHAPR